MNSQEPYQVNLFRPKAGRMRREVAQIIVVLVGWGGVTFGFQLLLSFLESSGRGERLTGFTFLNLPFHFWFTAQMLPLWFIIICVVFNVYMDRLSDDRSRKRDDYHV
jgi:putative solute:sodium symporter small subunit